MTDRQRADGEAIARAASALIGTRFRLHGRDPDYGLDCIGVVGEALAGAGFRIRTPHDYSLRNSRIAGFLQFAGMAGLQPAQLPAIAGDIVLTRPGPAQFHLLVYTGQNTFIHAHAGLRKVARMPGPLHDPIIHHWRFDRRLLCYHES